VATQIAYVEKLASKIQWFLGIPCEFYGLWRISMTKHGVVTN